MSFSSKTTIHRICTLLFLISFAYTPIVQAELYDDFNNPPGQARAFVRWEWTAKLPGEKEIVKQLDALKNAGIGGVEICPAAITAGADRENANAKLLKFAADEAKKRGMLVDLAIPWPLTLTSLQPGECIQTISLGSKTLKGPAVFSSGVNDLVKLADKTLTIGPDPNRRLMFIRLMTADLGRFTAGDEFVNTIQPDNLPGVAPAKSGSVDINVPDGNYVLYVGVLHENFRKPPGLSWGSVIDPLNERAVEKYFNNLSANLAPVFGGKLGDSIHAISCPGFGLAGANWTSDMEQQFNKRRGYELLPHLPVILDTNIPKERTRFYETVRRTRYDYCKTTAELLDERFLRTFNNFCRGNGVLSRIGLAENPLSLYFLDGNSPVDIFQSAGERPTPGDNAVASSVSHLAGKSIVSGEITNTAGSSQRLEDIQRAADLAFTSGVSQFIINDPAQRWIERPNFKNYSLLNARISSLFQNSRRQTSVAILCPTADLWSDLGLNPTAFIDYFWYLFPLWHALNHNGFTADYIGEKILQQSTFEDGKLHFGSITYDAVIVPDVVSIEFEPTRTLRFYAQAGGKIIFIGRPPEYAPGFKDLLDRSAPVSYTMYYIRKNDPNRVAFVPAPARGEQSRADKNQDNLTSWFADIAQKLNLQPAVRISPPNDNLFFAHYHAETRDIFFFTNTSRNAPLSFNAKFDTADKTPWLWDPQTGNRNVFHSGSKKDLLDIELQPLESVLLVFEPDSPGSPPASDRK